MRAYLVLLLLLLPLHASAIEPIKAMPCASPQELYAFNTRVLQSELMVAALSCNHKPQYSQFLSKFDNVLKKQLKVMNSYFERVNKKESNNAFMDFDTRLSNKLFEYSLFRPVENYCDLSKRSFEQVLAMNPAQLEKILTHYSRQDIHGLSVCAELVKK